MMKKLLSIAGLAATAVTLTVTAAPGTAHAEESAGGCYWPYTSFTDPDPGFGYYPEGSDHLGPADRTNPKAVKVRNFTCMNGQWVQTGELCFGSECPGEPERRLIADAVRTDPVYADWGVGSNDPYWLTGGEPWCVLCSGAGGGGGWGSYDDLFRAEEMLSY